MHEEATPDMEDAKHFTIKTVLDRAGAAKLISLQKIFPRKFGKYENNFPCKYDLLKVPGIVF